MRIPTDVKRELHRAIKLGAKAKAMKSEAEAMTKEAKGVLLPLMSAYEIESYPLQGVGVVTKRVNKGSNINETKLKEALLLQGLTPAKIEKAISKSKNSWSSEYVEFKAAAV